MPTPRLAILRRFLRPRDESLIPLGVLREYFHRPGEAELEAARIAAAFGRHAMAERLIERALLADPSLVDHMREDQILKANAERIRGAARGPPLDS